MASGVSTPVFRVRRGGVTLYLRLAETAEASLVPEALAHRLLRARGARVPEVVHLEPFNEALRRSVMVTTAILGRSIGEHSPGDRLAELLAAAGRDMAVFAGIPVDGFGWIQRDRPDLNRLAAELPTIRAFALGDLDARLAALPAFLTDDEIEAVRQAVARYEGLLDVDRAVLALGDLDASHIFHLDGEYTGIIDLGELRGADPLYDLGHVALHEGETPREALLPGLLAGYAEVAPLPADAESRIRFWSLLIGVQRLARGASRPRTIYHGHLVRAVQRALRDQPGTAGADARDGLSRAGGVLAAGEEDAEPVVGGVAEPAA